VTAGFRVLYVFVALELGSRRLVHFNVTEHPTTEWTLRQLREALPGDGDCKFLLHDRHSTFSPSLDEEVESWGIHVLRSPRLRHPSEFRSLVSHSPSVGPPFQYWPAHIGLWVQVFLTVPKLTSRLAVAVPKALSPPRVVAQPILGGLHHEYRWAEAA
jgi:hypothetical protein